MHRNIVLTGMPGCGKSEIGRRIAMLLGMEFVDVDGYIEENWGQIPVLFEKGEAHFRQIESKAVQTISKKQGCVVSTGGGVILRETNMRCLKENGIIVFIDRPLALLLNEVDTSHRPLLAEGRHKLIALYEQRIPLYRQYADITIDNSGDIDGAVIAAASALEGGI